MLSSIACLAAMTLSTIRTRLRRAILSRSGWLAHRARYPNPFRTPATAASVDVARDAGVGDVLIVTAVLRALRRRNPGSRIRFYTNFAGLVRGLPYIDEVLPYTDRPPTAIFLEYTDIVPAKHHIARLLGDRLGLAVRDTRPDIVADSKLVEPYRLAWAHLPRPHVIVLRRASRFTPNKDWPDDSWTALIASLCESGTVIEIGEASPGAATPPSANYVNLRGATTLPQLVAAIAAADIYVGPVSGPMHIAAAVGTPAVLIVGGYEHPANTEYAGNVAFYTQTPCAPCWLREPCPYDLKCLRAISASRVQHEVTSLWTGLASGKPPAGRIVTLQSNADAA